MIKRCDKVNSVKRQELLFIIHQKKRRLALLKQKHKKLSDDLENNKIRICFGSKKLFNKQFNLSDNGYETHEDWLKDWQSKRNQQFSYLGSKDESMGNQSCVITRQKNQVNQHQHMLREYPLGDHKYKLRLRLPNDFQNKYLTINNVDFKYGKSVIESAINDNLKRLTLKKSKDNHYKETGQAIYYRFSKSNCKLDEWRVFVTTEMTPPKIITDKQLGVIGVDLNADHLAVTETDRFGNPIHHWTIKLPLRGKTSNQRQAIIGDAIKKLVEISIKTKKPIVKEKLNFEKAKMELKRNNNIQYNRMLSSFSYHLIHCFLLSRCSRFGVECFDVNPAYTSIIGRVKFAKRYGLSVHHSAALVIGRRFLNFSEKPSYQKVQFVPTGKADHVTFILPVRKESKHVWSCWSVILRKFKTVLKAHIKAVKDRSSTDPPVFLTVKQMSDELAF
jgi:IS605 OrfB family transposase